MFQSNTLSQAAQIERINQYAMNSVEALATYAVLDQLKQAEQVALDVIREEVKGQPILDLGVGGGRTVAALTAISQEYVGVDYSQGMVDRCEARFPAVKFLHADARNLSGFADESFSMVVFSSEGICMVDHAGRLRVLQEVLRILRPGGVFIFSTMNKDSSYYARSFQFPEFDMTLNPFRFMVRGMRFLKASVCSLLNRAKNKKHEIFDKHYSIINDVYHEYSTMIYYISLPDQRVQLESIGFDVGGAVVFDLQGGIVEGASADNTLTFLVRKP